ncbi:MAG: sensor domain-containing diguanylate cyclase [Magnetococcales bacterium]|nr:sensor domain-containing diguanylate cyclase [Magnetococcales bacterium]
MVLDTLREGVYVTNTERVITFWNKAAEEITGCQFEEVVERACRDNILEHLDRNGEPLCETHCPLVATMRSGQQVETEGYLMHREGHRVPVFIRTAPVVDAQGKIVGACEVFGDISARMANARLMRELERLAMMDHLTQLANRRYTELKLAEWLAQARSTGVGVGVILYDIDYFKQVNDTHGHDMGDRVLRMVADTLRSGSRSPDLLGRWGGEEFLQLLPNITATTLEEVAERNRGLVEHSRIGFTGDLLLKVTVSLGATMIQPEDDLGTLFRRVDALLYQSKHQGRNRVSLG